jgi:hypothetical protein
MSSRMVPLTTSISRSAVKRTVAPRHPTPSLVRLLRPLRLARFRFCFCSTQLASIQVLHGKS